MRAEDGFVVGGAEKGAFLADWKIGDVVEARVERVRNEKVANAAIQESLHVQTFKTKEWLMEAKEVCVLAPCGAEFFVGKESPNYKKALIDLNFRENLRKRTLVVGKIREFFLKEGFIDAETPEMVRLPGMEPHLDVFKTAFRSWQAEGEAQDMYLITSPEYAMKKLLVAGYEKVFQICKSFRNRST